MNLWTFTGRLIGDPTYREVGGVRVCDFTVSVRTHGKDQQGYPNSVLARCTCWRGLADLCERFGVGKGKTLAISGELDLHEYTNKDGVLTKSLQVDVRDIDFLLEGRKQDETGDKKLPAPVVMTPNFADQPQVVDPGDELPF